MAIQQGTTREERLVKVHCLRPFRFRDGTVTRVVRAQQVDDTGKVTAQGEVVEMEFWLANMLANHTPPRVGPVTDLGEKAAARRQ